MIVFRVYSRVINRTGRARLVGPQNSSTFQWEDTMIGKSERASTRLENQAIAVLLLSSCQRVRWMCATPADISLNENPHTPIHMLHIPLSPAPTVADVAFRPA